MNYNESYVTRMREEQVKTSEIMENGAIQAPSFHLNISERSSAGHSRIPSQTMHYANYHHDDYTIGQHVTRFFSIFFDCLIICKKKD